MVKGHIVPKKCLRFRATSYWHQCGRICLDNLMFLVSYLNLFCLYVLLLCVGARGQVLAASVEGSRDRCSRLLISGDG